MILSSACQRWPADQPGPAGERGGPASVTPRNGTRSEPQYYRIVSDVPFRFYAGVTVPKIDGCPLTQRFSFDVLDGKLEPILAADGEKFEWWPWYEGFGKKWYWVGPEVGAEFKSDREFAAGTYFIRVFNAENRGRYVLAVGDIESFTPDVIAKTMIVMPGINRDFWDSVTCAPQ